MAAGIGLFPAFAQQDRSLVILPQQNTLVKGPALETDKSIPSMIPASGAKTTANSPSWFSYVDLLATPATRNYYWPMYSDSNLVHTPSSGSSFNIYTHGIGFILDPTDSAYFSEYTTAGVSDATMFPEFRVRSNNSYSVTKVSFLSSYHRVDPNDDTLVIQWTKAAKAGTNPFGIYSLSFINNGGNFATGIYDQGTNLFSDSIAPGTVQTMKVPMDDAYFADTASSGFSNFTSLGFDLPTPFAVGAGEVFLLYVTFQSGANYPTGTPSENANHMRVYTSDLTGMGGAYVQNEGSFQTGLWSTSQQKYAVDTNGFRYQGHLLFIPSNAYSEGAPRLPIMSFEVDCPSCDPVSVDQVAGNIQSLRAYPNPAQSMLYVPYQLNQASDVRLSLRNPMGQLVRVDTREAALQGRFELNVSDLPSGIYFYTLETGNGSRTERVVITR